MKSTKLLALFLLVLTLQPSLKSQVSYSGNTISQTAGSPSAIGDSNTVTGDYAFVGGYQSQATGDYSFAFGYQALAQKQNSVAFGYKSVASGLYSTAMGWTAVASGDYSLALGLQVEAMAPASVAIGRNLKASSSGAFVIGQGVNETTLLYNSVAYSLAVGFNSQYPTFFVSPSSGSTLTGKIGIGNITDPTAKLHVLADENEASELKLEHRTSGLRQYSQIYLGTHTIRAGNAENMVFTTPAGKSVSFQTDNFGIGTADPGARLQVTGGDVFVEDINSGIIMKSPDGRCWRGTMTNEGAMAFAETPCPSGSGYTAQPAEPEASDIRIYPNPSDGRFTIESSRLLNNVVVSIFTTDGRLVMEYNQPGSTKLQTDGFASGTYVVTITENGRLLKSQQVIVN